uniref:Putative LRR receptor-like serine/threonine-protein kinase n=1 Tax=Aegilops tauschii TaxID=37682 RepID=R7WB08_AEGTA
MAPSGLYIAPPLNTTPVPAAALPRSMALYAVVPDSQIRDATVERFLKEIAGEKPIRFTPQQLSGFTNNYSTRLGAVYKGMLPNGLAVAVKRLHPGQDDRTSQEQFMAEVGTIGRTHHINLVRLGCCYDADMVHILQSSLLHPLVGSNLIRTEDGKAGAGMVLRDDRGNIIYSSCRELFSCRDALEAEISACMEGLSLAIQRSDLPICIEMDSILAVNMLNDSGVNRSVYAALVQEIMHLKSLRVTHITHINRGQNYQQPEARPPMGVVVKMLEGEKDIAPPANPFQHLMAAQAAANRWTTVTSSVNTASTPANGVSRGSNEIV